MRRWLHCLIEAHDIIFHKFQAIFVCEPNISDDDPLIFAAIDAAKMRMVALSKTSLMRQEEEMKKVSEVSQLGKE